MLKTRQRQWKKKARPFTRGKVYCRFKETCEFKHIKKARYAKVKGVYYVLCTFQQLCNMQTFIPQKIDLRKSNGFDVKQMNMAKRKCLNPKCNNSITAWSKSGLCHKCSCYRNLHGRLP